VPRRPPGALGTPGWRRVRQRTRRARQAKRVARERRGSGCSPRRSQRHRTRANRERGARGAELQPIETTRSGEPCVSPGPGCGVARPDRAGARARRSAKQRLGIVVLGDRRQRRLGDECPMRRCCFGIGVASSDPRFIGEYASGFSHRSYSFTLLGKCEIEISFTPVVGNPGRNGSEKNHAPVVKALTVRLRRALAAHHAAALAHARQKTLGVERHELGPPFRRRSPSARKA
jgi:hypothetical protein